MTSATEPHFQMHKFGGGLQPISQQLERHLIVHQVRWHMPGCITGSHCEPQTGIFSVISPVKHHADMFSFSTLCPKCEVEILAHTELTYVPVDMNDRPSTEIAGPTSVQ